jgi:hypothetical protein
MDSTNRTADVTSQALFPHLPWVHEPEVGGAAIRRGEMPLTHGR